MSTAPTQIAVLPQSGLRGKRILVVFEPGRAGTTALDLARQLAERDHGEVTVVSIVTQAAPAPRCGCSPRDFNAMIREAAADELEQARDHLSQLGDRAAFALLIEGTDPPLDEFVAAAGFELVLLPARRRPLRSTKHPAAPALRHSGAEVRIVESRAHPVPALV